MPLVGPEMKARFQSRIYAGLQRVYTQYVNHGNNYLPIADHMWELLADAISDIAIDIVNEIHENAEVVPGQQVETKDSAGDTGTGETISPGKII
jgi:hypothetical protein